jgi:ATP/maltotriose-dependent transcriptional regulator MalT
MNIQMLLRALAALAWPEGDPARAMHLAAAADTISQRSGVVPFPPVLARQEGWLAPARAALSVSEQEAARAEGRAMPLERAVAYGLEIPSAAASAPGVSSASGASMDVSASGMLSPREREVLALVAEGKSNREIAEALVVTEHTAKYHVASLLNKLGATSRAEAVTRAVALGLLTPRAELRS